jgi:hypothetical protein
MKPKRPAPRSACPARLSKVPARGPARRLPRYTIFAIILNEGPGECHRLISRDQQNMPTMFIIDGPREVPFYEGRAGRTITDDNVRAFWEKNSDLANLRGCYVFGIRNRGLTPGYVGKATRAFKSEVFAPHKLTRYQQFLADYQKGTPIIYFAVAPRQRGAPNASHIQQLEDFLIQAGVAANSNLMNIKGTKTEEWGITGVLRSSVGKPSLSARQFRTLMKLAD